MDEIEWMKQREREDNLVEKVGKTAKWKVGERQSEREKERK